MTEEEDLLAKANKQLRDLGYTFSDETGWNPPQSNSLEKMFSGIDNFGQQLREEPLKGGAMLSLIHPVLGLGSTLYGLLSDEKGGFNFGNTEEGSMFGNLKLTSPSEMNQDFFKRWDEKREERRRARNIPVRLSHPAWTNLSKEGKIAWIKANPTDPLSQYWFNKAKTAGVDISSYM